MRRILVVGLLLAVLPIGLQGCQLFAQETEKAPRSGDLNDKEELPAATEQAEAALRGVMILRISERYLEQLFARDIDKHSQVTRVVLGTRARGTAHTKGRADVDTKPDHDDAAFYVRISGSTTSRTVGHNGPAVIHSRAVTNWTCQKTVRFDGEEFKAGPATITSDTRITPLGAGSTLPGLRGRIVSNIATRRAIEYNSRAERISNRDTDKQVLADVDRIVDQRIETLNERIESRPIMAFLLPKLEDMGVQFSTSSNCINVSFAGGDSSPLAKVCPVQGLDPSDTELWFQTSLIARPDGEIPEMIDNAGAWLAEMLPDVEIPGVDLVGKEGVLPVNVDMVDGWVVLRSTNLDATATAAKRSERNDTN